MTTNTPRKAPAISAAESTAYLNAFVATGASPAYLLAALAIGKTCEVAKALAMPLLILALGGGSAALGIKYGPDVWRAVVLHQPTVALVDATHKTPSAPR